MTICRVSGTVVATKRSDAIEGASFFLVQPTDQSGKPYGSPIVALDSVQAGEGDLVIVSQGSSCRQIPATREKAVDALIVGVVDLIDEDGTLRYRRNAS
jgi:microcompartment protein CcmK/EutM